MMHTLNVLIWRMPHLFFALMALAAALIGQPSFPMAQTTKFEGSYKGTIVLESATQGGLGAVNCDPSSRNFEQMMTISGDRMYLERKGSQQNVMFSGTVNSDGSVSASGLQRIESTISNQVNLLFAFTGRIDGNEFSGTMNSRVCGYSVKLKK